MILVIKHPITGEVLNFEAGPTTSVAPDVQVLWDERKQGPLDPTLRNELDALDVDGQGALILNRTQRDARLAAKQARVDLRALIQSELKALDLSQPLTAGQIQQAVKHLIRFLRGDL